MISLIFVSGNFSLIMLNRRSLSAFITDTELKRETQNLQMNLMISKTVIIPQPALKKLSVILVQVLVNR